jgi:Peptidase propeptide and YPEB domain
MPTIKQALLNLVLVAGALYSGQALADRPPTPEERSRIEDMLRREGFTNWGLIELDDGLWDVDNALASDGRRYDLKLRPDTLDIVGSEEDEED